MVTTVNYVHTKFSRILHPCLSLESLICLVPNIICYNVSRNKTRQRHLCYMTAKYGAVTVRALPVTHVKTFQEYADNVFIPHLERQLRDTKRVEVVWDEYRPDSLKEGMREKQGEGVRRKVSDDTKLPGFLHGLITLRIPVVRSCGLQHPS